nr:putative ribonuclease H-like domain-containing protein [Tanacetum cinerariifolium]
MNQVLNENERLLKQVINKDIVNIAVNSNVDNASMNVHECEKYLKLKTELLNKKDFIKKETYDKLFRALKNDLRKLKGKALVDDASHTIALEMLKVDVEPLAPKLLNNKTSHSDYLRHTQEQAAILKEVVEQGKSQNPLNNSLDNALGNACHLTRITTTNEVPSRKPIALETDTPKPVVTLVYSRKPRKSKSTDPVSKSKFCDSNLKVAFRQHTCFIRNLEGVDLLTRSRGNNLYTLSLREMMASSPICPLSKASKTKSWLWHRRLSHLNFDVINHLARHGLVRGLPKLKFEKDHLCSACAMGKSKKKPHKPKSEDTNQEKLYLLHMDLCGPIRVTRVILNEVEEDNHGLEIAHMNNDQFFGVEGSPKTPTFCDDPLHEESNSQGSSSNMRQTHTSFESLGRWTKDHPITNVIDNPSRFVSTRK